jgi:uroporphyrinogen decarboxylase
MVAAGADCLSIDNEADIEKAKHLVGDKVMLMGNVRPSEVMLQGDVALVEKATAECLYKVYDSPRGAIIASGCSLPTETPFENIHAMLNTVRRIGNPFNIKRKEQVV